MSKLLKRVGKKTIKFQIDLRVEKVDVNIKFPCQLFIIWKRGPRNRETKKVDMDLNTGSATFNEDLTLNATLFQDAKTKKFQEKKSTLTIVIVTPKGNKIAGACDFDVSTYPNQGHAGTEKRETLPLKKSPDPNAKVTFSIRVTLLSEVDNMSMMSDIMEQDSEEEAGSMDVSQFERDVSRTEEPQAMQPVKRRSKSSMDNVLGNLASKNNLEEEVKQAQFKQDEESPKVPGLSQSSNKPINPRKLNAEQETLATGGELKKPGFAKLFNKEDGLKAPSRSGARMGEKSVLQENNPVFNEEPVHMKTSSDKTNGHRPENGVSEGADPREMHRLKDELARTKEDLKRMRNTLEDLKQENEDLKMNGQGSEATDEVVMELRNKISDKNNEISDLNKKADDLEKTIDELRQNIYKLNKEKNQENRGVAQEIEKLKDQNKKAEHDKANLQTEIQNQQSKISKLEQDLKNLKSDYNILRQENAGNLELYNNLRDEKEHLVDTSKNTDLEVKKHKDKIGNLEQEIQRMREQLKAVSIERDDFQKKGLETKNIAKEKIRVVEEENNKLKERLAEIEKIYKEQLSKTENSVLELKKQLKEAEAKREDALSKQTAQAIELQNLKINFERVNSDLEYKKKSEESKSKDMDSIKEGADKEITKLRDRLAEVESKYKTSELQSQQKIEELKQSYEKHKAMYEEANAEKEKLQNALKNKDHENNMKNVNQTTELDNLKKEFEAQKQIMTQNIELRDTAFNNLKKENKSFMEQVEGLKQRNAELEAQVKQGKEVPQFNSQVNDLEEKLRISESNSKLVNKELKAENEKLKKELGAIQKNNKAGQDVEKEVGILSIENETLKKQVKELTAKVNNTKISADNLNAKDNEDLKKKIKDLQKSLKRTEEDYSETKSKLAATQTKNEQDSSLILKLNQKVETLEESVSLVEVELVKTKQKIGEIMNVLGDSTESDLVERVHNVIYGS